MNYATQKVDDFEIDFKKLDPNNKFEVRGGKSVSVSKRVLRAMAKPFVKFNQWVDNTFFYTDEELEDVKEQIKENATEEREEVKEEMAEQMEFEKEENASKKQGDSTRTPQEELSLIDRYIEFFSKKLLEANPAVDSAAQEKYWENIRRLTNRAAELKAIIEKEKGTASKPKPELEVLESERETLLEEIAKHERGDEEALSMAAPYPGASLESLKSYLKKIDDRIAVLQSDIANEKTDEKETKGQTFGESAQQPTTTMGEEQVSAEKTAPQLGKSTKTPREELFVVNRYIQSFTRRLREAEAAGDLAAQEKYRENIRKLDKRAAELTAIIENEKARTSKPKTELERWETERATLLEEIAKHERGDEEVFSMSARYPGASLESLKNYLKKIDDRITNLQADVVKETATGEEIKTQTFAEPVQEQEATTMTEEQVSEVKTAEQGEETLEDKELADEEEAIEIEMETNEAEKTKPEWTGDEPVWERKEAEEAMTKQAASEPTMNEKPVEDKKDQIAEEYQVLMAEKTAVEEKLKEMENVYFSDEKTQLQEYLTKLNYRLEQLDKTREAKRAEQTAEVDYKQLLKERAAIQAELDKLRDVYFSDEKERLRVYLLEIDQRIAEIERKQATNASREATLAPEDEKTQETEVGEAQPTMEQGRYQSLMNERASIVAELEKLKDSHFNDDKLHLQAELNKVDNEISQLTGEKTTQDSVEQHKTEPAMSDDDKVVQLQKQIQQLEELVQDNETQDLTAIITSLEQLAETLNVTVEQLKNHVNNQIKDSEEKKVM